MKTLTRYWFEFESLPRPSALNIGCGVTAHNVDDAKSLMQEWIFSGEPLPKIRRIVESVNVSNLDERHVLPNIGQVAMRGVWFPKS